MSTLQEIQDRHNQLERVNKTEAAEFERVMGRPYPFALLAMFEYFEQLEEDSDEDIEFEGVASHTDRGELLKMVEKLEARMEAVRRIVYADTANIYKTELIKAEIGEKKT